MRAKELDQWIECTVCDGSGEDPAAVDHDCRRCEGSGEINRYGPADTSAHGREEVVILAEEVTDTGALHVERMPISDAETGGFDERYGPKTIADLDGSRARGFEADMRDRLQNDLGKSVDATGQYELPDASPYDGARYDSSDLPDNRWPSADMPVEAVIAWLEARGDTHAAGIFEDIAAERRP